MEIPEDHALGDIIVTPEMTEYVDMEMVNKFPIQHMFRADEDIYSLQSHRVNNNFNLEYQEAVEAYIEGEWDFALEQLNKCLSLDPEDPPANELRNYIFEENNNQVPEDWYGYRRVSISYYHYYSSNLQIY